MVIRFVQNYPLGSLIFFSFLITFFLTLSYKLFSNQKEIKLSKDKIKEIQTRIKEEKDSEKIMALQKEMLEVNMSHLKHSMKPLMITFLPLILTFWALRVTYVPFGNLISYQWNVPLFCSVLRGVCDGAGWFLVYLVSSFVFNLILRKIMKVH